MGGTSSFSYLGVIIISRFPGSLAATIGVARFPFGGDGLVGQARLPLLGSYRYFPDCKKLLLYLPVRSKFS